ncbi:Hypothetical protein, putative [Bodo saltans]|uniref:Uncharacterized protein n=1 Tax=Bodo saltans TaxID=75058 RepID=A0A0S4JFQ1_BODSA|nr:Hypothetical protein, putative [Bodo saltans]|eukprot:CUG90387.1 Hypothetical protein, putative [Bodo saltans]
MIIARFPSVCNELMDFCHMGFLRKWGREAPDNEIVKNVPGYLGLWVEMKAKYIRGEEVPNVMSIEDLVMPFVGNLEKELIANPKLFTDYWRAVANRQGNANELKVARDGVLKGLEKLGAILPRAKLVEQQDEHGKKKTVKDAGRYYLSPLVITHPWLRGALNMV